MTLSIVTPFYNEADGLEDFSRRVRLLADYLRARGVSVEFILVNDGSTDGSAALADTLFGADPRFKIIHRKRNGGFGAALRTGLLAARGDIVVTIDADTNYNHLEIPFLLEMMTTPDPKTGKLPDVATGSPFHPDGYRAGFPWYRFLFSISVFHLYKWALAGHCCVHTMTCGFRAYRQEVLPKIISESDDFLATAEMLVNAMRHNLTIVEYPTTVTDRRFGRSKLPTLRMIRRHLGLIGKVWKETRTNRFLRSV